MTNYEVMQHNVPKCTCCGYIGEWKIESVFRPIDWVIGIILLFMGIVPGVAYLGVVAAIRSDKNRRDKICPKCNDRNLWTFLY